MNMRMEIVRIIIAFMAAACLFAVAVNEITCLFREIKK